MMKRGTKHQILGSIGSHPPSTAGVQKSSKINKNAANHSIHSVEDNN